MFFRRFRPRRRRADEADLGPLRPADHVLRPPALLDPPLWLLDPLTSFLGPLDQPMMMVEHREAQVLPLSQRPRADSRLGLSFASVLRGSTDSSFHLEEAAQAQCRLAADAGHGGSGHARQSGAADASDNQHERRELAHVPLWPVAAVVGSGLGGIRIDCKCESCVQATHIFVGGTGGRDAVSSRFLLRRVRTRRLAAKCEE